MALTANETGSYTLGKAWVQVAQAGSAMVQSENGPFRWIISSTSASGLAADAGYENPEANDLDHNILDLTVPTGKALYLRTDEQSLVVKITAADPQV